MVFLQFVPSSLAMRNTSRTLNRLNPPISIEAPYPQLEALSPCHIPPLLKTKERLPIVRPETLRGCLPFCCRVLPARGLAPWAGGSFCCLSLTFCGFPFKALLIWQSAVEAVALDVAMVAKAFVYAHGHPRLLAMSRRSVQYCSD